jgi:hypothetical protein
MLTRREQKGEDMTMLRYVLSMSFCLLGAPLIPLHRRERSCASYDRNCICG